MQYIKIGSVFVNLSSITDLDDMAKGSFHQIFKFPKR